MRNPSVTLQRVDAFEALADPTRRRVLSTLARQPRTAGALAAAEATSRPAVSRHLRVLRVAGLVRVTPSGRERRYELDLAGLAPVTAFLEDLQRAGERPSLSALAAGRLDALELEVRRTVRERRTVQVDEPVHPHQQLPRKETA